MNPRKILGIKLTDIINSDKCEMKLADIDTINIAIYESKDGEAAAYLYFGHDGSLEVLGAQKVEITK